MASIELRSIGGSMAERKKRSRFGRFVEDWAGEAGGVSTYFGFHHLSKVYDEVKKDIRAGYLQNITSATRSKKPKQVKFHKPAELKQIKREYAKRLAMAKKNKQLKLWNFPKPPKPLLLPPPKPKTIDPEPLLLKDEAQTLRNKVKYRFKKDPRRSKFAFFKDFRRDIEAIRNPYGYHREKRSFKSLFRFKKADRGGLGLVVNPGFKRFKSWTLDKETGNELRKRNIRTLKRTLKRATPKALIFAGIGFGSLPLAKAIEAKYSKKRKFKKSLRRNISRGIVQPVYGYAGGSALDVALTRYPYLRGSKKIRALEGKYAQKYGQGVQFYKGTSGMRVEDIAKLDRDLARIAEQRRRAKRRRGK